MRFQDRSPAAVEPDDFLEEDDLLKEENGESQDMWSLMRPEPRGDAFASLLAGDGGREYKFDAKFAPPWDLVPPKRYVPLARSRSSLSNDSLQLCTEGLGCESCDCLLDSDSSSSATSYVMADDILLKHDEEIKEENEEEEENEADEEFEEKEEEVEEKNHSARTFPPPLPTLYASSAAHLRSFKTGGRFVLQSVKAPLQNIIHSHREGGRLQMHLVSTTEGDDLALPLAPKPQNEELPEEIEEGFGEDQGSNPAFSDIPALPQLNSLAEDSSANQCDSSSKCNRSPAPRELIKVACSKPPEKHEGIDNESSNRKREIPEGKYSPKHPATCQNIYSGWRNEIGEQNNAVFCRNWQNTQDLPNYPISKLKHGEAAVRMMNVHVNVNDHARFSKFRVNDLGLARCHDANSLSVWRKYPCIATSS